MSELKYRVYDKVEKCYCDNAFSIDQFGDCYVQDEDGYWEEIDEERYAVERCTGLKDKNDKEIYEGDIIRICRSYGYGFLPKGAMAIVFYDENECCYKLQKQGEFRLTSKKIVEVIGNIHENLELLGKVEHYAD